MTAIAPPIPDDVSDAAAYDLLRRIAEKAIEPMLDKTPADKTIGQHRHEMTALLFEAVQFVSARAAKIIVVTNRDSFPSSSTGGPRMTAGGMTRIYLIAQRNAWHHDVPGDWNEVAWERFDYVECAIFEKPTAELTDADRNDWVRHYSERPAGWIEPMER